jgi:hypothetical protein
LRQSGKKEVARYAYRDASGQLLGFVVRLEDTKGKKIVLPLTYCKNEKGFACWRWKGFGEHRTLYGLEHLALESEKPVLIVEGEKTAEAARHLAVLQDYLIVSWHGGVGAIKRVDWQPLLGRDTVLWPDHDAVGVKAMQSIAEKLHGINQAGNVFATIRWVELPEDVPEKWDLADALPAGWKVGKIHKLIEKAPILKASRESVTRMSSEVEAYFGWSELSSDFVQETLTRYKQNFPVLAPAGFSAKVQAGYQQRVALHQLQGIRLSEQDKTQLKEHAILTEVLFEKTREKSNKYKLDECDAIQQRASEIASILQDYPNCDWEAAVQPLFSDEHYQQKLQLVEKSLLIQQYHPDHAAPSSAQQQIIDICQNFEKLAYQNPISLQWIGAYLQDKNLTETLIQQYQAHPVISEMQFLTLISQNLLALNLNGELLNQQANQQILEQAKRFESLWHTGEVYAEIQHLQEILPSMESDVAGLQALQQQLMDTGWLTHQMSQKPMEASQQDRLRLQQASQRVQQLQHHISTQAILARDMEKMTQITTLEKRHEHEIERD